MIFACLFPHNQQLRIEELGQTTNDDDDDDDIFSQPKSSQPSYRGKTESLLVGTSTYYGIVYILCERRHIG
jgi:hypothetical protein